MSKVQKVSVVRDAESTAIEEVDRRLTQDIQAVDDKLSAVISLNEKGVAVAFVAAEKAVNAALAAADKAVAKAELAADKRFESVNEFRAQLNDQAGTFLPRAEYSVQHIALIDAVDANTKRLDDKLDTAVSVLQASINTVSSQQQTQTGSLLGGQRVWAVVLSGVMTLLFSVSTLVAVLSIATHGKL